MKLEKNFNLKALYKYIISFLALFGKFQRRKKPSHGDAGARVHGEEASLPRYEASFPRYEASSSRCEASFPRYENSLPGYEASLPRYENSVPGYENSMINIRKFDDQYTKIRFPDTKLGVASPSL